MPLSVNTNVTSLVSQRHLNFNAFKLGRSMEKLASGYRINRAGDDAAGLQISENLRAAIRGSKKALGNTQDGINVLNIADGALETIQNNLQRMRELAVQGGNDTYDAAARGAINAEINALGADNTRILAATTFNGTALFGATMNLQVGHENTGNDVINVTAALAAPAAVAPAAAIADNASAQAYINSMDTAITNVSTSRGAIGAFVNRLEGTANNLQIAIENFSSSESRIRDVDVAAESAEMTRFQILQQSSAAMLAQANQAPSIALSLLG